MSYAIRIVGTTVGIPTQFDGKWVKKYDPSFVHPEGYDGGIFEVTADPHEAMQFPNAPAAFACWRQTAPCPYHVREDGKPNRPLTAFSIEVLPAPGESQ